MQGSEETSVCGVTWDSFAVNVKSVAVARTIGMGDKQLVLFYADLVAPKSVHHTTFTAIGKKVHDAAGNLT